jgi:hypothetical protein
MKEYLASNGTLHDIQIKVRIMGRYGMAAPAQSVAEIMAMGRRSNQSF